MDITSSGMSLQTATSSMNDGSRQQAAMNSSAEGKAGLLKDASLPANMALQLVQSAAQTTGGHIDIYA